MEIWRELGDRVFSVLILGDADANGVGGIGGLGGY